MNIKDLEIIEDQHYRGFWMLNIGRMALSEIISQHNLQVLCRITLIKRISILSNWAVEKFKSHLIILRDELWDASNSGCTNKSAHQQKTLYDFFPFRKLLYYDKVCASKIWPRIKMNFSFSSSHKSQHILLGYKGKQFQETYDKKKLHSSLDFWASY